MTTLVETPLQAQPTRRRFTVDEYHVMVKAGILCEHDRVELINGEVIAMTPIGDEHMATVDIGTRFLVTAIGDRGIVRVQGSIRWDEHNVPQPDFSVLSPRGDFYRSGPAGPEDVLLLIEVSDTSLAYDRNVKLALYARFSIPEVWIANIPSRVIEVYTDPIDGEYTTRSTYRAGESVVPMAFDDVSLPVADIIGGDTQAEN